MAMQREIVGGVYELEQNINTLLSQLNQGDFKKALYEGGLVVERHAKENIRSQRLIDTGNLRASIRAWMYGKECWIGTGVIYAAIHEFGGTIFPKKAGGKLMWTDKSGAFHQADHVTIPARPYLRPALFENLAEIVDAIRLAAGRLIIEALKS